MPVIQNPTSKPNAAAAKKTASEKPVTDSKPSKLSQTVKIIANSAALGAVIKIKDAAVKDPKLSAPIPANPQELLAMADEQYMSQPQLIYFKQVLEKMRADILVNATETSEHLRENVVVPDPADRATIEEEHAIELRTRDRERKLLKKIAQAIDVIDRGEYGWCEETGDMIGLKRLLARPTATLSLEAQQRRELRQKMYGD